MKGYVRFYALFHLLVATFALERQLTVNVQPRQQDCFYEPIKDKEVVEVDYQVIDGVNLDVTFQAHDPKGRVIVADIKKSGNTHRFTTEMSGDFKFCFDNSFSTLSDKTVFFEIMIGEDDDSFENMDNLNPEDVYEVKVQDILEIINRVKADITKSRHLQDVIKSIEAKDRNTAEGTNAMVFVSSLIQVLSMLTVCMLHCNAVKSLFEPTKMAYAMAWVTSKLKW